MKQTMSFILISGLFSIDAVAGTVQGTSLDSVRQACENPASIHNQVAPSNMQITCREVKYAWQPIVGQSIDLPTANYITASLQSDKINTNAVTVAQQAPVQTVTCPAYQQTMETVETVRPVTCEEIALDKRSSTEFCADAISTLRAANPAAVRTTLGKDKVVLCGGTSAPTKPVGKPGPLK
jgi:hypothetical protein